MTVYKAALPYDRRGPDMSWMRVPILLLGLFVVAITQGAVRAVLSSRRYTGVLWLYNRRCVS